MFYLVFKNHTIILYPTDLCNYKLSTYNKKEFGILTHKIENSYPNTLE